MRALQPGWYIVLYHNVSWEENCYARAIGGTCPPDLFRSHVKKIASLGEIVSIPEGEKRLQAKAIDAPLFSFWFDDGLTGVGKYAAPILEQFGACGATSVCHRFMNRIEFFWRYKLAYLTSVDGLRFLRPRLAKHGYKKGDSVKDFTLDNFSLDILAAIDELFMRFTTDAQRRDAFRLFMDRGAVASLLNKGWTISNHTGGHYPISQAHSLHLLGQEFEECETELTALCGQETEYWVLPFDRNTAANTVSIANETRGERYIVFVGDNFNTAASSNSDRILYRIIAPMGSADRLMDRITKARAG